MQKRSREPDWRRDRVVVPLQLNVLSSCPPVVLSSSSYWPAEIVKVTVRVPGATGAVAEALSV
jgi:hypothetical protein